MDKYVVHGKLEIGKEQMHKCGIGGWDCIRMVNGKFSFWGGVGKEKFSWGKREKMGGIYRRVGDI